jgi:CheY-like chemotaxis protein
MKTVLIAEDDRVLRARVVHALNKTGKDLNLMEAGDGEEALAQLKADPADLVITDIGMPRVNGLMVVAYLNAFLPHVPCFVMTSYGTSRLKSKMPPDLLRFYQKPFDVKDMARSALAVLERKIDPAVCRGAALIHILDLIAGEKKTCTITVTGREGKVSRMYLVAGELWDASVEDLTGEAAAVETLTWQRPGYCIDDDIPDSVEKCIHIPLDDLLRTVAECSWSPSSGQS